MALAVAILLATVFGAYSASLPALPDLSLPEVLETSLDTALDALGSEKSRRSVLDDVKQLLDTQISALLEDGVKRIAGKKGILKRRLKPKKGRRNSRRPLIMDDKKAYPSEDVSQEIENSELIKALTDSSLQDSADIALRNTVDELLQEDEVKIEQNNSNNSGVLQDNGEDNPAIVEKSTNSQDEENQNELSHDTSQKLTKRKHKHRRNNKVQTKEVNHVIIEHSPKKHEDLEALDSIVDLDEVLKSTLKDLSDSISPEDDVTDQDDDSVDEYISHEIKTQHVGENNQNKKKSLSRKRIHAKPNEHESHQIDNSSTNEQKIVSSEDGQLETVNHITIDENEVLIRGLRRNENNEPLKNHNSKETQHERNLNEKEDDHFINTRIDENSRQKHNEIKNHHSKIHHITHQHKTNTTYEAIPYHKEHDHYTNDKSDNLNANNALKNQLKEDKYQNHDQISHIDTAEIKSHTQENNKNNAVSSDNYGLLTTKETVNSGEQNNAYQMKSTEIINVTEVKNEGGNALHDYEQVTKKKNATKKRNLINIHKNPYKEISTEIDKNEDITEEKANITNEKQSEENSSMDKTEKENSKEKDNIAEEVKSLTNANQNERKGDVTDEDESVSEEKETAEEESSDSVEKKDITKEHKAEKDEELCSSKKHRAKNKSLQSVESEVIQDLIHNKDMKKSYTFTLSLTTK